MQHSELNIVFDPRYVAAGRWHRGWCRCLRLAHLADMVDPANDVRSRAAKQASRMRAATECQDGQGARPYRAADATHQRRRDNRISAPTSGIGTGRTWRDVCYESVMRAKLD